MILSLSGWALPFLEKAGVEDRVEEDGLLMVGEVALLLVEEGQLALEPVEGCRAGGRGRGGCLLLLRVSITVYQLSEWMRSCRVNRVSISAYQ